MNKFIACEIRNGKQFVKKVIPTMLICAVMIFAFKTIIAERVETDELELSGYSMSHKINLVRHSIL